MKKEKLNEAQSAATMLNLRPNFLLSQRKLLDEEAQSAATMLNLRPNFLLSQRKLLDEKIQSLNLPEHYFCEASTMRIGALHCTNIEQQSASPDKGCAIRTRALVKFQG